MAALVLEMLAGRYSRRDIQLRFENAWELLVATVLAAQCTDARVNMVTPEFFRRWPGPAQLAQADIEEIEQVIHSTGFYRNKAKNLKACAIMTHEVYNDELPRQMSELTKLPGVARKTANVVLFGGFGLNEGLAVDTHVKRISHRLGLTASTDPVQVEKDLMRLFPREQWGNVNNWMVWFGREVCKARKPDCSGCAMETVCPRLEPPGGAKKDKGDRS